jgi:hypothetical protein
VDPQAAQQPLDFPSPSLPQRAWGRVLGLLEPSTSWAHHGARDQDKAPQTLLHSARFVLVDRQGQIRQYYDSRDEDALHRLQHHARRLLQR